MILPTGRTVALAAAGAPLGAVVAAAAPAAWPLVVIYLGAILCLFLFDLAMAALPRSLSTQTLVPPVLGIGRTGEFGLRVHNGGSFGLRLELRLDTDEERLEAEVPAPLRLASGEARELYIALTPRRRGTARVHRLWLQWSGPLGLGRIRIVREVGGEVRIVPDIAAVRESQIRVSLADDFHGAKLQRGIGEGQEYDALREFVAGMDHRSIDWKHSARHRKLLSKEYRVERNHNVVIAVDTGRLMSEHLDGIPKLDHAINAALLLGYAALRGGDRVGLFGFDARPGVYHEPVHGIGGFRALQLACARLDYGFDESNFTLGVSTLMDRLNRRSLMVVFTDFVDTITAELMMEQIGRLTRNHLVLFVTFDDQELARPRLARPETLLDVARATVAEDMRAERRVVLERLRRLGVQCLELPPRAFAATVVERYFEIKQRGQL